MASEPQNLLRLIRMKFGSPQIERIILLQRFALLQYMQL